MSVHVTRIAIVSFSWRQFRAGGAGQKAGSARRDLGREAGRRPFPSSPLRPTTAGVVRKTASAGNERTASTAARPPSPSRGSPDQSIRPACPVLTNAGCAGRERAANSEHVFR